MHLVLARFSLKDYAFKKKNQKKKKKTTTTKKQKTKTNLEKEAISCSILNNIILWCLMFEKQTIMVIGFWPWE